MIGLLVALFSVALTVYVYHLGHQTTALEGQGVQPSLDDRIRELEEDVRVPIEDLVTTAERRALWGFVGPRSADNLTPGELNFAVHFGHVPTTDELLKFERELAQGRRDPEVDIEVRQQAIQEMTEQLSHVMEYHSALQLAIYQVDHQQEVPVLPKGVTAASVGDLTVTTWPAPRGIHE